jgi:probable phosphoglycerate mutase
LRHGQIKGHETKRFIGQTDVSLDDQGKNQALKWHKLFASIRFNAVYSSSLKRCLDTAQVVCPKHDIHIVPSLNEINMGQWDGKTFAEIKKDRPEEFKKRGSQIHQFRPANGESFKDLSDRVLPFFNDIGKSQTQLKIKNSQNATGTSKIQNRARIPDNKILVVTHAGVIRVLICHILGMNPEDLFEIKLDYGQLYVLKI